MREDEKRSVLNRQLQNNILSFYKGLNFRTGERVMATAKISEKKTQFKNNAMLVFNGHFTCNAALPDLAGIGKAVSRGFGSVTLT